MGRTTLIEHDVPVEMRDGTVLRADVWRAADGPASPAVLFRTPYGKSPLGLATLTPAQCVDRGYAAVVQDTRGRFGSEGEWAPLDWSQEGPDGYDTVEWTAGQPWCDGNVAMAGTSYQAIVQWLAAMEKPPHLRAIAPTMSTSAPFDAEQLGGFLRLDHLTSWLGLTALEWVQRRAAAGDPVDGAVVAEVVQLLTSPEVPLRRWPLSTILDFEGFPGRLRDIFAGRVATVADYHLGEVGVPTFSVGGWYDVFSHGTIELHRAMRAQDPVAGRHELVVGPWVHSGQLPQVQGEVNTGPYGSAQGARLADLHLDFFDRHLRPAGGTTGRDSGGDVRYFLFGDDAWHRAASWPPPEAVDAPWYLAGPVDGDGGGRLLPAPPQEAPGHDAFTYDPEDPVPSHGGRVLQLGRLAAGPLNQAHLEGRPDVLCYTSEPLTESLDVVGRQRLRLRFGSDASATAVVAKLTDVHPDGRSLLVAEASLRLEAGGDGPRDEPYEADLLLGDTAWRFAPGHRLRVHVTSSNFPHLDRHPNIPGPVGEAEHCRTARQSVWYGGPYESVLRLRILPATSTGESA
ncbi:CocE/NonD family hydrolase [Streptomyces sp. NPDC017556]|uniref:CocE/NonD family hydrolase n=1 Tax=Streptomyces sp. NPDC017556 TaxID=3365002 RepID=UPI0037B9C8DA